MKIRFNTSLEKVLFLLFKTLIYFLLVQVGSVDENIYSHSGFRAEINQLDYRE